MRVNHIDKFQASKRQIGSDIFIVPTDDEKLKIVIIPTDTLTVPVDSFSNLSLIF